jgi:RNA polymerase sigma-70 factor (ECF subfamily)
MYEERFFVLSLKYCKNEQEAQDNLQDSFLEIFRKIKQYKGKGSFEGWMKRIVINKAIDRYKKELLKRPLDEHIQAEESVDIEEPLNIPLDQILSCIQNLPTQYRLVFNLYVLDDYSHKEIAKMLSIREGTSKSNLHRAKLILKEQIEELKKQR